MGIPDEVESRIARLDDVAVYVAPVYRSRGSALLRSKTHQLLRVLALFDALSNCGMLMVSAHA